MKGSPRFQADGPPGYVLTSRLAIVLLLISLSGCSGTRDVAQPQSNAQPMVPSLISATAPSAPGSEATHVPSALALSPASLSASLAYRAMLREDQANERLESGEKVTMEVEVSNTGVIPARDVMLRFSGTPVLVEQFSNPVPIGDMQSNEMKRVVISARMPPTEAARQGELMLSLESTNGASPVQKKFPIEWHPRHSLTGVSSVHDVDRIPDISGGSERKQTVGIAIGISSFRHPTLSPVLFAAHDAAVMAAYFNKLTGIPSEQVRLLTDEHALKDDLIEVFEEWLPQHAGSGSDVMIFIAGRASANPSTGAVSLIPHEADPGSPLRLVSLRRLHEALARLPIQHAVLMLDLTWTSSGDEPSANGKEPAWPAVPAGLRGDKLVQLVGTSGHQQGHQYEEGRHGLFTYFVLKGLGGAADRDQNGIVAAGELCGYVQEHVTMAAKEKYRQPQHPLCVPPINPASKTAGLPLSRLK